MKFWTLILVGLVSVPSAWLSAQDAVVDKTSKDAPKLTAEGEVEGVAPPADADDLPQEIKDLLKPLQEANEASRKVFEPLTAEQLNFRPSDGSHTARWNAEHLAGSQLLFVSEVYHSLDPRIPVFKLTPKQMPKDYAPRHPEWSGKQEADWMRRVDRFTRRYAGLLKDVDLDAKPPAGPFPTYRAMLTGLAKHYQQHTANVEKKFKDPQWPDKTGK